MFRVLYCLRDHHDWKLVALAAIVCLISSGVTVMMIARARLYVERNDQAGDKASRRSYVTWVAASGAAAGFAIWATHFIAMLAYNPGAPMTFSPGLTLLSLLVAVALTAGGIETGVSQAFRGASLVGGAVVGAGIAAMHFIGMAALNLPSRLVWAPDLVFVSIAAGMALSATAMWSINRFRRNLVWRAAPLLTLAIVCHHFVAMGAVTVLPDPTRIVTGLSLSPTAMASALFCAAAAVMAVCMFAVIWGQRFDAMRADTDRRFKVLLEGLEDTLLFLLDREGRVLDWKNGAERNNRYPVKDIVGRVYGDVCALDAAFPLRYREALATAAAEGRAELEALVKDADGVPFWGHTTLRALRDDAGELLGYASITQDVTARKADQDRRLEATRNLDAALSHMSQGLLLFDRNEKLVLANRRFLDIYGLDAAQVAPGRSFRDLLATLMTTRDGVEPPVEEIEAWHARNRALIARPGGGDMVSDFFPHRTMSVSHRPMEDGGWVTTFEDISERRRAEARIAHMARHDGLTGLPNRLHLNSHLDAELARAAAADEKLAVIAIDLNGFRAINDRHGHSIGDRMLKAVAARLQDALRDGEFAARFGADEFAAVKPYRDAASLDDFLTRLSDAVSAVSEVMDADGRILSLSGGAAIGAALFPQDAATRETLLNNANLAMWRARASHSDPLCFFNAATDEAARDRRALTHDLERALENNEFRLFYQVQQSVATGQITGYEALIRWSHPQRGFVSPADFIPLAEESGAIVAIGEWVLRTACEEAARWDAPLRIAVNLSPVQLSDERLIATVRETLIGTGLSPSRLELEITETSIIEDRVRALHILRQIKALGVSIAIDDFGTGYASLDTLGAFPFDKIKIDRSFLMQADSSPQAHAIVRAILALGRSLDIPVLAEGVETPGQLELLRAEACAEAQGYLLGRPQPYAETTLRAAG
jgi:diguanylate cyclase (GGDEF)-like protein/PAS domain S-box-containing protein